MELNKIKEEFYEHVKSEEKYFDLMYDKYPRMKEYIQEAHQLSVTEIFAEIKKMVQEIHDVKASEDETVELTIKLGVFENEVARLIEVHGTRILTEPNLVNKDHYYYIDEYPKDIQRRKI